MFYKYCKSFDMMSIAFIITELCYYNNLNYEKYKPFINKLLDPTENRYHNAKEVLIERLWLR
jgi:hypothetical protein